MQEKILCCSTSSKQTYYPCSGWGDQYFSHSESENTRDLINIFISQLIIEIV